MGKNNTPSHCYTENCQLVFKQPEFMKGFFPLSKIQASKPDVGLVPKCGACQLYKACKSPKMEPYGKGAKEVLVVGEFPGETEDNESRPFLGQGGMLLRETLREIGIDLDKDAISTNAIICRPNAIAPVQKQVEYCRPNLIHTIKQHRPRVIITLGRAALASVLHPYWNDIGMSVDRWTGWHIPISDHWICPTHHPNHILRANNAMLEGLFSDQLEAAFSIKEQPPASVPYQIECLYDDDQVWESLRAIDKEGGWASLDYETNCLKPEYPKAAVRSCAVSNGRKTISYPWTPKARKATGIFIRSKRTYKIASNLKMEERWTLHEFGFGVSNWGWDTMLAAHCLDNRPGICSLKFQSLVKMGVSSYNENIEPYLESHKGHYNRIQEIAIPHLLHYGGMDAILEHRLAMLQRKELGYES
jgi:uracil-DNA glycosylase